MNTELKEAIELLEKEKGISKASLLDSIEQSLMTACKSHFGKNDNIIVKIDPELKVVMVRGAVPGVKDCTLIIKSAVKK